MDALRRGILSASVTVFNKGGQIDEAGTRTHIRYLLDGGVMGLISLAVTGEFASLSYAERIRIVDLTLDEVAGRVPVIMGVTTTAIDETLGLARHAKAAGASAIFVITPYFYRYTDQELSTFFRTVADVVAPLHVQIYNSPGTGQNLSVAFLGELSRIDNVLSLKEGNAGQLADDIATFGEKVAVFCARDTYLLETLALGGAGATSVAACVAPRLILDLYRAWERGDLEGARAIHRRMLPLINALVTRSYPAPIKAALDLLGVGGGPVRAPLSDLSETERRALRGVLVDCQLI
jgi:4-hydroxy-tetrahydrodipicolinate synthase